MNDNPAFQFYPKDWLIDLGEHPLEIEGAWIRFCAKAWVDDSHCSITLNLDQWARLFRTDRGNALRILTYIQTEKIGDVSVFPQTFSVNSPDKITVICRRMQRIEKEKEKDRLRKKSTYEKKSSRKSLRDFSGSSPENLTSPSPSPSPSPSSQDNISYPPHISSHPQSGDENGGGDGGGNGKKSGSKIPHHPIQFAEDFPLELQQIFDAYPEPRQDRTEAMHAHRKSIADGDWPGLSVILADLLERTQTPDWTRENSRFAPMLSKYIRGRKWLDPMPSARASPADDPISDIAARIRNEQKQEAGAP